MKNNHLYLIIVILALVFINGFIWWGIFSNQNISTLDFLDVGQGDASLLSFKNSGRVLIDAGPGNIISQALGGVLDFFNQKIDVLIITHADWDHFGGMFEVIQKNNPRVLVYNGILSEDKNFQNLLKLAKEKKIVIIKFLAGDKIKIGDNYLETIYPLTLKSDLSDNRQSLVFNANINKKKILFLGDAEVKDLISLPDLKADILKVSHHGSLTGASQDLIKKISPQIALIGVGKNNRYGHPKADILSWLKYYGAKILRTDLLGNIHLNLSPAVGRREVIEI